MASMQHREENGEVFRRTVKCTLKIIQVVFRSLLAGPFFLTVISSVSDFSFY